MIMKMLLLIGICINQLEMTMNIEFIDAVKEYRQVIQQSLSGDLEKFNEYHAKLPHAPIAPTPVLPNWMVNLSYARVGNGKQHMVVEEWDDADDGAGVIENDAPTINNEEILEKGKLFSSEGPAPYVGDILSNEELVWADDEWTPEKEAHAQAKLAEQAKSGKPATEYWRNKYVKEAGRFWHSFYKRNEDHFYKDRHYLHVVFPELLTQPTSSSDPYDKFWFLLEIGSGVGNAIWPLLDLNPLLRVSAMDFAKSAIELLNKRALKPENLVETSDPSSQPRAWGHVRSIIDSNFQVPPPTLSPVEIERSDAIRRNNNAIPQFPGYDIALCMFVLSAIAPEDHRLALQNIYQALRGSKDNKDRKSYVMIRDYGRYDEAQLRFKGDAKLEENFYVRQDGTCAYFFTLDELIRLAGEIGFHCEESYYIHRQYANRQKKQARYRVWIHLKLSC